MEIDRSLFEQIIAGLPDAVTVQDRNFKIVYQNDAVRKKFGSHLGEECLRVYEGRDRICEGCGMQEVFATGEPALVVRTVDEGDGTTSVWENSCFPLFDVEGEIVAGVELCREVGKDLLERKKAEDSLRRLNRKLRAISNCNQVLLRAGDEQVLLDEICRIVCEEAGYLLAWVGYARDDEKKSIEPVKWAGRDSDYVTDIRLSWDGETEAGQGPAGTAIRDGQTIQVQDIATDSRMIPWRESALQRGYRAAIALPLKGEGRVFGVLLVYSGEPGSIVPDEVEMLEGLADNLAYGITALRRRFAHREAKRQISLLSNTLDMMHEAAYLLDDVARLYFVSEESCRALGYSREELLGFRVFDIDPDYTEARWKETVEELRLRRSLTLETHHRRKDGRVFPVEIHASFLELDGEEYVVALARDISQRKLMEDALFFVAQRGWLAGAENFFPALAQFLGESLDMDYVIIDELDADSDMAETLALYAAGAIVPNLRYALKGTPCENVMGRHLCVFPQDVQRLFPEDTLLVEMGVESYIGIPLWDSYGRPIGLIALMDGKPLADDKPATQLLQLVATRAAAELERARSDRILRAREREFRTLAENSPDHIARYDADCRTVYLNPALEKTLGLQASERLGKTPLEMPGIDEAKAYQEKIAGVLATGEASEMDLVLPDRGEGVRYHNVRFVAERGEDGAISGVLTIGRDITERRIAEEERNANLWFFECMDRVNRAIQGADDLERMMGDVLDVVLSVFDCDRAYLLYPCAPDAEYWWIPMERSRPEYTRWQVMGVKTPMDPGGADSQRRLLAAKGPVRFGLGTDDPLPPQIEQQSGIGCFMAMAVRPKVDRPWQFGIQQCSRVRRWTVDEERLFEAIGLRLADGISILLSHRELKDNVGKLEEAQRIAHIGYWDRDLAEGTIVLAAEVCRIFGIAEQEAVFDLKQWHKRWLTLLHPEDRRRAEQAAKDALLGGPRYDLDYRIVRPDGEVRFVHSEANVTFDETGHPTRMLGMMQDITDQRQAEAELRKLSQAIEQSPVSIVITDTKGRIEFVNGKFCEVSGYSRAEALGQNPRILKTGQTSAEEYRRLWQTISAGKVWNGKFLNRRKNGEMFWENATIAPVRDGQQRITHYVAVKEDITERKRLEEQLHQAQKLESVGRLAGGMAHDFNNMLSVILGHTQLAMEKVQPEHPMNLNLQEILKATERSAELTRQLLAFARKQVIAPKVIDLNEALEGMLKMLRRLIGEDIDLAWIPENRPLPVNMDPTQLDQILVNLCVNARDAISGVGKVTIETCSIDFDETYCTDHAEAIPGEYCLLAVSDDGRGMDRATLERIFEPFFTTKEVGQGTGLGLATVYGIVKQNQGFINVYSEPAQGTTFKIYLPRLSDDALPDQRERRVESIARGDETILLVEDEPGILDMAQQMLESCGYRVLTAATPREAIAMVKECADEVQLLISDVVMPEMTGPELKMKISTICPRLRCLYISGYPTNVIVRHGVLNEGVHFLQKPFTLQALAGKVREVLDDRQETD